VNKRIATALALAGFLVLGPAASAASAEPASASGYEAEPARDDVLDHGQETPAEDDHDHDGDGKPDHDPEDHGHDDDEDDEAPKPKKPKG
jgi:Spy/CpxP family protein refolding chaperone